VPGRGGQGVAVSSTTAGPRERRWRTLVAAAVRYCALLAATLSGWWLFARISLAAPDLFAALAVAIVFAVAGVGPPRPARPIVMLAQGMLAVTIGLSVQRETLTALGSHWPAVVTIAVATLVLSVLAGLALSLHRDVDVVTGALGMIAGGATGLVAVAADLGADERTVVVAQYLRVALVVLTMPLVATYALGVDASRSSEPVIESAARTSWWAGLLFMAVAIVVGTGAATLLRLPIPATLGPLILSAAVELGGWAGDISVPPAVMPFAFVIIGWLAGLSFDRPSIKALGRIFVWALGLMLAVIAACAGLGALLSLWTGVGLLRGYLATTPGGLAAVLAVASASDSDVTFVAASQVIRLVLMLLSAPAIVWMTARWLRRRADASPTVDEQASSAWDNHDRAAAGHDHQRVVTRRSCRALRRCALRHRSPRWCGRRRPRHTSKRCGVPRCPMRS